MHFGGASTPEAEGGEGGAGSEEEMGDAEQDAERAGEARARHVRAPRRCRKREAEQGRAGG
jgi:hypothetical protein